MKIVKQNVEFIGELNPLKKIELAARVCYKSEDSITDDSCNGMVRGLYKRGHTAMLEHGHLLFVSPWVDKENIPDMYNEITFHAIANPYLALSSEEDKSNDTLRYIISGPIRTFIEGQPMVPLFRFLTAQYLLKEGCFDVSCFEDENAMETIRDFSCGGAIELHTYDDGFFDECSLRTRIAHARFTYKFTVDRGVSHELVRHRAMSFAQSSTRYCNYNSGKFGNEITVISPLPDNDETPAITNAYRLWKSICENAEEAYNIMTDKDILGIEPQIARSILPNSLMTEVVVTGTFDSWMHFFDLRYFEKTGKAHPMMKEVAAIAFDHFKNIIIGGRMTVDNILGQGVFASIEEDEIEHAEAEIVEDNSVVFPGSKS